MINAVIFAGGTGSRMKSSTKPKQFLELHGKPIIIYTLEHFESHPKIDNIVVVCIEEWIDYLQELLEKFHIKKVSKIVPGGKTGQMSIFNGLNALNDIKESDQDIVLIHDGVRPLINELTISNNIDCIKQNGNAITVKPVIETVIQVNDNNSITNVIDRDSCQTAVAPQGFFLKDIYQTHLNAQKENLFDFTDSATLMRYYGKQLYTIMGSSENIKITTPSDFYIFRAISELRENAQILG
ncbi:2-C-methyl-D-erythritol 4-phosphate cytidylyltransferase [Haemophilus paracuniculus]|uniref:Ribitol-5-phosphate cytidylyltransferase n=1 Tax=Haemophilus paracuniculus TaxID=734 RepID=A0A1T0ATQ2_9PAST|nr:2-C-methyl-D-erythritol 4-phosphate cytidylyltransferase [Haemophilus paracuniculus]OOR99860.1 2-C-methyl-D-erythritol 4-phosphate cytidylyltransferase [Haemophilus paracuniculus]